MPIIVLVIFVALEAGYAFVLAKSLSEGAGMASRALAYEYRANPQIATDSTSQQAIFSRIRIENVISGNEQFEIPSGGWQVSAEPKTVTVVVKYLPGKGSPALPAFPDPDPLNLGSAFTVAVTSTYRLQE